MQHLTFWQYTRQHGLETPDLIILLVGLAVLIASGFIARNVRRDMRQQKPLTYGDVVSPFAGVFISAVCFLIAYSTPRKHYLLRGGVARYTAARVFKYGNEKGDDKFVYEYYVAGQRYQSSRKCGVKDWQQQPCPALGNRYYVRFSPENPGTEEFTDIFVLDTLRTIPPLGWARLP